MLGLGVAYAEGLGVGGEGGSRSKGIKPNKTFLSALSGYLSVNIRALAHLHEDMTQHISIKDVAKNYFF